MENEEKIMDEAKIKRFWIMEVALLHFEGASLEDLRVKYGFKEEFVKEGIELALSLRSKGKLLELLENE